MSSFNVPVVRVGRVGKHPNADALSITQADGFPVICRTGDFVEGDLAVYVPVDSLLPVSDPRFAFLAPEARVDGLARLKAKRLRGIFSRGLLVAAPAGLALGDDAAAALGVTKWEPPTDVSQAAGAQAPDPGFAPKYGVEHYERNRHAFEPLFPGDPVGVVVTEKIHGCNARYGWVNGAYHVGSHSTWRLRDAKNTWWAASEQHGLEGKLAAKPGYVVYGEVYGAGVQDLTYAVPKGALGFVAFDVLEVESGRFLTYGALRDFCNELQIRMAPKLYEGPYVASVVEPLKDGKSLIAPGQIREGFVIRRSDGQYAPFKSISEAYLLRKNATENH